MPNDRVGVLTAVRLANREAASNGSSANETSTTAAMRRPNAPHSAGFMNLGFWEALTVLVMILSVRRKLMSNTLGRLRSVGKL